MNDISHALAAKTDQLNADDLKLNGPITIKITHTVVKESGEQMVWVHFEGDNGKPWKPCKSMLWVLGEVWTKKSIEWAGRSLALYRDPAVKMKGQIVGGIRISHMSHIDKDVTIMITATRGVRVPYTVKPLRIASPADRPQTAAEPTPEQKAAAARKKAAAIIASIAAATTADAIDLLMSNESEVLDRMKAASADEYDRIIAAERFAQESFQSPPTNE